MDNDNILSIGSSFDVEVDWTEIINNPSPLGEVTFPFEKDMKGVLHFPVAILQHPFFQAFEKIILTQIEEKKLIKGAVDAIKINSWKFASNNTEIVDVDIEKLCSECFDKVGHQEVTKEVFQWLIDNDYTISKKI